MSQRKSSATRRTGSRTASSAIASDARAKRARDHLARKRRKERQRIERERSRAANARRRARKRSMLTPVLFGVAFGFGLVVALPLAERVLFGDSPLERIAVLGASTLSPAAIAEGLGIEAGRPLREIDPDEVREAALREPWIESVRSLRLFDGTLVVAIVERDAIARLGMDEGGRDSEALIDHRGDRFHGELPPDESLPLILGEIDASRSLSAEAIALLEELRRHPEFAANASDLTLRLPTDADEKTLGYVLEIGAEGVQALLGQTFLAQRIARLAALLESEESTLRSARFIDLRYADRAVLRSEPASG